MATSLEETEEEVRSFTFTQIPIIWWKIVKIGAVDPGIISLKKTKITEGKINSSVGKFAERAK